MERNDRADLLQLQAEQRYPLPPRLVPVLAAAYAAARDDADALQRVQALTEHDPELREVFHRRGAMVSIVMHLVNMGAEYDPVTDRWRLPPPGEPGTMPPSAPPAPAAAQGWNDTSTSRDAQHQTQQLQRLVAAGRDRQTERLHRLLAAAQRVREGARLDPAHPNQLLVSKDAIDQLGAVLAELY